jgi:hypothetical protein
VKSERLTNGSPSYQFEPRPVKLFCVRSRRQDARRTLRRSQVLFPGISENPQFVTTSTHLLFALFAAESDPCCATNSPLVVGECRADNSMSNSEWSISKILLPDPKSLRPCDPPRATRNYETSENPKYFPIYFKSVNNSRVSS